MDKHKASPASKRPPIRPFPILMIIIHGNVSDNVGLSHKNVLHYGLLLPKLRQGLLFLPKLLAPWGDL
jgi:hypothetical protein